MELDDNQWCIHLFVCRFLSKLLFNIYFIFIVYIESLVIFRLALAIEKSIFSLVFQFFL